MTTKHTPGPWQVSNDWSQFIKIEKKRDTRRLFYSNYIELALVMAVDGRTDEAQANARLIAAAPDLLAACKMVLDAILREDDLVVAFRGEDLEQIKRAIARAEGDES